MGLVLLGIGLHYFLSPVRRQQVIDFVNNVRLEPRNFYLTWALEKVLAVKVHMLGMFRIGCFIYAALYFIEGIGVLLEKEWAEWVIVISTSLFLPLELYEIYKEHHFGARAVVRGECCDDGLSLFPHSHAETNQTCEGTLGIEGTGGDLPKRGDAG